VALVAARIRYTLAAITARLMNRVANAARAAEVAVVRLAVVVAAMLRVITNRVGVAIAHRIRIRSIAATPVVADASKFTDVAGALGICLAIGAAAVVVPMDKAAAKSIAATMPAIHLLAAILAMAMETGSAPARVIGHDTTPASM